MAYLQASLRAHAVLLLGICWTAIVADESENQLTSSCGEEPVDRGFQLFDRIVQGQTCSNKQGCFSQLECVLEQSYPKYDDSAAVGLGRAGTYGEITPEGVATVLDTMSVLGAPLDPSDAFFDLGSGVGKMVVQSHLTTRVGSSIGIELDGVRHKQAIGAYDSLIAAAGASASLPPSESYIGFVEGDVMDTSLWANASAIYASVLCFPPEMLVKLSWLFADTLQPGAVVFSLMPLPGCHRGLWHIGSLDAQMTWTNQFEVHVYVVPPTPFTPPTWLSVDEEMWEASRREVIKFNDSASVEDYVSAALQQWDCSERVCSRSATHRSFASLLVWKKKPRRIHGHMDISTPLLLSDVMSAIMGKLRGHKKSSPDCLYEELEGALVAEGNTAGPLCAKLIGNVANINMVSGGTTAFHALTRSFTPTKTAGSILIESRADIEMRDRSGKLPINYAAQIGHTEVIKLILSHRANINAVENVSNATPLHDAVRLARRDAAFVLLDAGANASALDSSGKAPLHLLREGEERLMRGLMEHRADANVKDRQGKSPLHQVAGMGSARLLKLFVEFRADVNTVDFTGNRPLHGSVARNSIDVALMLLHQDADVNAKSKAGVTALAQATMFGHVRMVETLLSNRASPSISDSSGVQPMYYAQTSGHATLIEILQNGMQHAQEL